MYFMVNARMSWLGQAYFGEITPQFTDTPNWTTCFYDGVNRSDFWVGVKICNDEM